ncbi:endoglucanase [Legionella busanensis]|uniref:cellulase n=1 Tax=Legionella busanensis TaxID=190655 RepID=A0A378JK82_9GAMM|nr:cellulose binding domain-containing protein [Legionella busanensis]STX51487.1 endoglucanase [Legionella busanensis]
MFIKRNISKGLIGLLVSTSSHAFYTQSGSIYDSAGNIVKIDGISWSGFQDSKIVQGLASNPFYAVGNFSTNYSKTYGMMDALVRPWDFTDSGVTKANGVAFKTIRLPIQPGVLYDNTGQVDMNRSLANKAEPTRANGIFCKVWETNGSACAQTVTPQEAFWITLEEFKKNNVKVLIDFHHKYGYGDGFRDGTVYSLTQYEADLKLLANEIKARNLTNVIGIDVFNEPHRLFWFRDNADQPAWIKVIATAAKVFKQYNPDVLLFVEGSGPGSGDPDQPVACVKETDLVPNPEAYAISDDPTNCATGTKRVEFKGNWGEDFKPLLDKANAKNGVPSFNRAGFIQQLKTAGLDDATITWLMGDATANKAHLVFSPHVYPREVGTWESAPGKPSELRFNWTWGFLKKAGYPVVLGEASWKSAEGLAFFQKALVPYMIANGMQNDLFFWAVGYLGDTISLIDPNGGAINLQAEKVLHDLFSQTIATGKLNVTFTSPGFPVKGAATLTVKETQQTYSCDITNGCSLDLDSGSYNLLVADSYQIDNTAHLVYQVKASNSPITFKITNGQATDVNVSLQGQQIGTQPATQVSYKVNLLDEKGNPVSTQALTTQLTFTSDVNNQNILTCTTQNGVCSSTIYNQNINSKTGAFSNETYQVGLPNSITFNGKTYSLVADKSARSLTVTGTANQLQLNAVYQTGAVSQQNCNVKFTLQNRWDSGAVFQGSITNTSTNAAIKSFTFKISFNGSEISNPTIVSYWIGSNQTYSMNGGVFTFSANTYDPYNGLPPGQQQGIGFQVSGAMTKDPTVTVISCEAK